MKKNKEPKLETPSLKSVASLQRDIGADFYKTIVQRTLEGFILLSFAGDILDANEAFCKMHECSREELLNKKIYDFSCDGKITQEEYIELVEGHKKTGGAIFETRHKCKNGKILDLIVSSKYLDVDGGLFLSFHTDITKQKQINKQLQESEERYRALIDLGGEVGEAIIMLQDYDDTEAAQVFISEHWLNITGYSREELLGKSFFNMVHPKDRPSSIKRHRQKVSGKSIPGHFELSIVRKDGSCVPVELTSAITMHKGKPANVAYIRDMTRRKEMEKALADERDRYRCLFEEAPVAILEDDYSAFKRYTDGLKSRGISDFRKYFSKSFKEIVENNLFGNNIGMNDALLKSFQVKNRDDFHSFISESILKQNEIGKSHLDTLIRLAEGQQNFTKTEKITTFEGTVRHVQTKVSVAPGYEDTLSRVYITFWDITEQKQAEESAERDRQELSLIINSSPIIVFYKDTAGRFIRVNKAFSEALKKPVEELVGKTVFDLYSASIAQRMAEDDKEVFNTGLPKLNIIEKYESASGLRWVQTDKIPIYDKDCFPAGLIGFAQDITERRQAEKELSNYKKHLEKLVYRRTRELEKQVAQNIQFTRALVHELKTPLTTLLASSDLLVDSVEEKSLSTLAKHIQQGALNLDKRINELLDLAKGELGMLQLDCKYMDMVRFLHYMAEYVAPEAAKKRHAFNTDLPSGKQIVWGDQDRLQQVVLNILDNAFKFTPEEGSITLRAARRGSSVVVEIQDSGCGIIEKKQELLFKPYHRHVKTDKNYSGLGLGLALSKTLLELHDGKIWAESDGLTGSTFCFSLPIVENKSDNK